MEWNPSCRCQAPVLLVYEPHVWEQPICPGVGYLWIPGNWVWYHTVGCKLILS